MDFCNCEDWFQIRRYYKSVFKWQPPYGWIMTWKELTNEKKHTQIHTYGINISYCPMCGKKLPIYTEE